MNCLLAPIGTASPRLAALARSFVSSISSRMDQLSLKITLKPSLAPPTIRKILHSPTAGTWTTLATTISSRFGLLNDSFALTWTDSDGDNITLVHYSLPLAHLEPFKLTPPPPLVVERGTRRTPCHSPPGNHLSLLHYRTLLRHQSPRLGPRLVLHNFVLRHLVCGRR
jgi:hypothetical protein